MRHGSYHRYMISLDSGDYFRATTPTGEIMVRTAQHTGLEKDPDETLVMIRGFAINRDGRQGLIQRTAHAKLKDLPNFLQHFILTEYDNEVKNLAVG